MQKLIVYSNSKRINQRIKLHESNCIISMLNMGSYEEKCVKLFCSETNLAIMFIG